MAGGTPLEFNTIVISDGITMGTEGMKTSLISREVIADSIELMVRGYMFDGVIALSGCDKTIPGTVMALARLNRPGLMLYGISPLPEFQSRLRAVMALKSHITLVRTLPAGHGVSYGRDYITTRPTRVATVGIGYGDGFPRSLSGNGAEVFIRGRRFPIIGRITMDQTMIDLTDAPEIHEGEEVELFGPNLPVAELAAKAGTIVWEILTGITPRVVRRYIPR